ncbi:hypothetical protein R6Z07M_016691 [Ovis aries]
MFEPSLSALFMRSNALILGMETVLPDFPIDSESRNLRLHHVPESRGKPRRSGSTAWREAAARVAGLVSWQPRNAPPRVKQVAAASLLPLAVGSSACSSAVRLPVGVGLFFVSGSLFNI